MNPWESKYYAGSGQYEIFREKPNGWRFLSSRATTGYGEVLPGFSLVGFDIREKSPYESGTDYRALTTDILELKDTQNGGTSWCSEVTPIVIIPKTKYLVRLEAINDSTLKILPVN